MPISKSVIWEVRQATGSDNNGAGFKTGATGVDYSQQASPQYALTGIASVGAGNTILSALAAADMVGNTANVISGTNFNTGLFEITSVSVGVSITFSTNTAGSSICTGVGASGVINIGGAAASLAFLNTNIDSGQSAYCKGTFTLAATITWNSNFLTAGNGGVNIYGYTTTRGDNGRATITSATNSVALMTYGSTARDYHWWNFNFTHTAGTRGIGVTTTNNQIAARIAFDNCVFDGCLYAMRVDSGSFDSGIVGLVFRDCEIKNSIVNGVEQPATTILIDCYVHDNAGHGVVLIKGFDGSRGTLIASGCTFYNNTVNGLYDLTQNGDTLSGATLSVARNCNFVSNGGSGFVSRSQPHLMVAENCIFYANGVYGWDFGDFVGIAAGGYNAYGANVTGPRDNVGVMAGDVTLTGDPFTNKAGGDFSLNSTAGAGAACKQVGFPGVSKFGTGYADIGPLSPQAGGGGTTIVIGRNVTNYLGEQGDF